MRKKLIICLLGVLACGPSAFAIAFTGDVQADFTDAAVLYAMDVPGDVGLPANAPAGTVSGWDLDYAAFLLDPVTHQLHVGLDFFGIAGDADGDGAEGITSMWLFENLGIDIGMLGQTESICMALDIEYDGVPDGIYDIIAGVNAVDGSHRVSAFTGLAILPAFGFGPVQPLHDGGHLWGPDYELTLDNIDQLINPDLPTFCIDVLVFAGSYQDDGIGEDLLIDRVCFERDIVHAVDPANPLLLQAYPNPFNPGTTLSVELAKTDMVRLAVYNINGQLVQTLVDGMMTAGRHELSFNGAGLPSGLYLARLSTPDGEQVTRLLLTK